MSSAHENLQKEDGIDDLDQAELDIKKVDTEEPTKENPEVQSILEGPREIEELDDLSLSYIAIHSNDMNTKKKALNNIENEGIAEETEDRMSNHDIIKEKIQNVQE